MIAGDCYATRFLEERSGWQIVEHVTNDFFEFMQNCCYHWFGTPRCKLYLEKRITTLCIGKVNIKRLARDIFPSSRAVKTFIVHCCLSLNNGWIDRLLLPFGFKKNLISKSWFQGLDDLWDGYAVNRDRALNCLLR